MDDALKNTTKNIKWDTTYSNMKLSVKLVLGSHIFRLRPRTSLGLVQFSPHE